MAGQRGGDKKEREQLVLAAVCYAGINGNPGMPGASDWIHMRWRMGVSPESGGAGGKGVMRKRASRDKERGTLTEIQI
jgi:hypothetical protein